jgi:hypothetical protein
MNFTREQYQLIMIAVREYQQIYNVDKKTYGECQEILDMLMNLVYTQGREQPR